MEIIRFPHDQEATAIETFEYLQEHQLIVCREHGYALRNLDRHLLEYHVYPRTIRKAIAQRFSGLPRVAPENAPLPKAYGQPIEAIEPPRLGFLCGEEDCGFISISRTRIAQHCNGHGWRSTRSEREHWADVWVQSFCSKSGRQRWFTVTVEGRETTEYAAPMPADVQAQKKEILLDFRAQRAERKLHLEVLDAEIA